jgi:hypothetical protein
VAQELVLAEGQRLDISDVLRRVATAFRYVCIDWLGGDRTTDGAAEMMRQLNVPQELIDEQLRETGKRVQVLVSDSGDVNARVFFQMGPNQPLLAHDPSQQYQPPYQALLEKLGELLGGRFEESLWN